MTQKNMLLGEVNKVKWAVEAKTFGDFQALRFSGDINRCTKRKQQQCACRLRLGGASVLSFSHRGLLVAP